MKYNMCSMKVALVAALVAAVIGFAAPSRAADLPQAQSSPLTGLSFDDPPYQLPLDRNFQMALMTVSSELGRTCSAMEAYGWRADKTAQERVNKIFKSSIDKLRAAGYTVEPETMKTQSKDITVYTADRFTPDRNNKHFMFLWSAGDKGLVLNLCETNGPLAPPSHSSIAPTVEVFPLPAQGLAPPRAAEFWRTKNKKVASTGGFSPAGKWIGGYTCAQGFTGGTLDIKPLHGEDFKGTFEFYPVEKNPGVPRGSYAVYGQYDKESKRILINPGKWIKQPRGYFNTVIVGSFDPEKETFSAFFQGIKGCTSFEARREGSGYLSLTPKKLMSEEREVKKRSVRRVKKAKPAIAVDKAPVAPVQDAIPPLEDKNQGIVFPPSSSSPQPQVQPQVQPQPASPPPQASPPQSSQSPLPAFVPQPSPPAEKN